jgi:hypothetical protein
MLPTGDGEVVDVAFDAGDHGGAVPAQQVGHDEPGGLSGSGGATTMTEVAVGASTSLPSWLPTHSRPPAQGSSAPGRGGAARSGLRSRWRAQTRAFSRSLVRWRCRQPSCHSSQPCTARSAAAVSARLSSAAIARGRHGWAIACARVWGRLPGASSISRPGTWVSGTLQPAPARCASTQTATQAIAATAATAPMAARASSAHSSSRELAPPVISRPERGSGGAARTVTRAAPHQRPTSRGRCPPDGVRRRTGRGRRG